MSLSHQFFELFVMAIPIACISWTITHEEVFREPREFCFDRSKFCKHFYARKFFYIFTCEYCFSHYVTIAFFALSRFKLVFMDWRGYVISGFSLVWIANLYMSIFGRVRIGIKAERMEASAIERELEESRRKS